MEGSATPPAAGETPPETPPPANPPTPPAEPPAPAATGAEARIRQLNEEKKAADDRAKAAEKALSDREKADMSEKERAERERDEAKQEAADATAKATRLERSAMARKAGAANNFIDPEDAVAHLDLAALDTETKIENAVKKLAEEKTHLVGTRPSSGFGTPGGSAAAGTSGAPPAPAAGEGEDARAAQEDEAGRDLLGILRGGRG